MTADYAQEQTRKQTQLTTVTVCAHADLSACLLNHHPNTAVSHTAEQTAANLVVIWKHSADEFADVLGSLHMSCAVLGCSHNNKM